jgi:hypothetical protein
MMTSILPFSQESNNMSGEGKSDRELLEKMIDHLMVDSEAYVKWKTEIIIAIEAMKLEYVNDFHKLKELIEKQITETRLSHEAEFHPEIAKTPLQLEVQKEKKTVSKMRWGQLLIGIIGGGGIIGLFAILESIFHFIR